MQLAARQGGLEHVGGVHRPLGLARTHQGVQLVDEQDDVALAVLHLLQQGLQPLLELAAILGTGHQGAEIERQQPAVAQGFRHVAVDDAVRQALGDGGLADAGLADQHRVVLGPARQHLDDAADLLVAADHRVELARARGLGEIARVLLERVVAFLGTAALCRAALAHLVDGVAQRLGVDPGRRQRLGGVGAAHRQRQQQLLDGDEAVAGLLRDLLGLVEQPRRLGRHVELAGPAALDLGLLLEQFLGRPLCRLGVAAGGRDQVGGHAFRIVEQHLQEMLGQEPLVALAQCQALGRLQEALRAVRVFFDVHDFFSFCPSCERTIPAGPDVRHPSVLRFIWSVPHAAQGVESRGFTTLGRGLARIDRGTPRTRSGWSASNSDEG